MTPPVTGTSYVDVLNRDRFTYRMFVLLGLFFVLIGRVQEVFLFLVPFRLALVFYILTIPVILGLAKEERFHIFNTDIREMKILLGFFGVGWLSLLFSSYTMASLEFMTKNFLINILFFIIVVNIVRTSADLIRIIWALLFTLFLLVIPALLGSTEGRWATVGASYDPNDTALLIVVTLPFVLNLVSKTSGLRKLFLLSSIPLFLYALTATGSRGGFLGFAVVLSFLLFRARSLSFPKKLGIVIVLAMAFLWLAPDSFKQRISAIGSEEDYNITDVAGRKQIWERSLELIAHNPVFGVGPGCFQIASGFAFSEEAGGVTWRLTAHNSFILVATEMGLAGLACYLMFLLRSMTTMRRIRRDAVVNPALAEESWFAFSLEASLLGYMVCAFFLSFYYSPLSYFLVALGVAYQRILAEKTGYIAGGELPWEPAKPPFVPREPYAAGPE